MKNITDVCPKDSAYKFRPQTDTLFALSEGSFDYSGIIDTAIRHIESIQLLDEKLWKSCVEQFTFPSDSEYLSWKGEFWGKMMRGAALTYKYTKNPKLYEVLNKTVEDLLATQDSLGRICTYSVEKEFDGWDLWCRKYVLLGLEYFLDICCDKDLYSRVITAMQKHADYIMQKVGPAEQGKKEINECTRNWFGLNSSSILEPYVRLYNLTDDKRYLDFSEYIVKSGGVSNGDIFELAYENKVNPFEYPTNKAYEMMSCFEGLLEYYRVTKIEKYKTAVINFAKKVLDSDITLIGCAGCRHELFDNATKSQTTTTFFDVMQETCVTVTWMKFCNQLLSLTGDVIFADAIETSVYNAMLGAVNLDNVNMLNGFAFDSYAPLFMNVRARKSGGFLRLASYVPSFGCCACIGSAGTALMGLSSVMQSKDGIYFNLYIPGNVYAKTPIGNDFTFNIKTEYPADENISIVLNSLKGDEEFTIAFRIPSWCDNAQVSVNGEAVSFKDKGYLKITRKWTFGDTITLNFDMPVKAVLPPFGGHDENSKHLIALSRGPVIFARDARLSEKIDTVVDIDFDKDFVVKAEKTSAPYSNITAYKIFNKDGSYFTVTDFASAGKTWNEESFMTVWMPTENFWSIDETKPVEMNNYICDFSIDEDGQILRPTRSIREKAHFMLEKQPDGTYLIKDEKDRYLTAVFIQSHSRYQIFVKPKGYEHQNWVLENAAINKYRLRSATLGLSVCHAFAFFDVFILVDDKNNDYIEGFSFTNNGFVDIRNV